MIVAGVMSGTSADGIDVALVRITSRKKNRNKAPGFHWPTFQLLAHAEYPYPKDVRRAVLAAMNAMHTSVADLARLNFLLGELYAEAVAATQEKYGFKVELVGCHGQTLYHQGEPGAFLGRNLAVTWQTGEGSVIAARLGVPVVSDFRTADMAAGGKGAPLVPFLDYTLYRSPSIGRVVQNIGGIANLTAIPAGSSPQQVQAFDTGPGNMVIDAVMDQLYDKPYDIDGSVAATGAVMEHILSELLCAPFFLRKPPKTAGREEFGREFVGDFLRRCRRSRKQDIVATATALTARSISHALRRFVVKVPGSYKELVISGGGAKNPTLLSMMNAELAKPGIQLRLSDEFGLPTEAKEAVAFAVLAFQSWHGQPSNIPSATGASRPAILGKISYV
ncbi:MAG TPA: anhydro-N-acetylmuramic acid kinase [Terriglobales bacterium]|nr:anhydro-N-acetylmuramic acid kinase [Terriglobales bacterium]